MHTPDQILVVEDDPTSLEAFASYYEVEGFRVVRARDGDDMDREFKRHKIDLVVLDIRLPGKDGLTLLRELRTHSNVPVIVVSARTEDVDHIVALEIGADDYLNKPVHLRNLLARTKNILRRATDHTNDAAPVTKERQDFNGWVLDRRGRRLTSPAGQDVHLTRGEFDLLSYMASRSGRVLQREQLLDALGDREWHPFDRSIDVLVGRLRSKIERNPKSPTLIVTVHGVGYVFIGNTERRSPEKNRIL